MRRSNELRLGRDGRIMGCHKDVTTLISRRTRLAAVDQQLDPRILSLSRENRYAISRPRGLDQIPRRSPLAITIDDQLGTTAEGLEAEIAGTAARLRLGRTAHSLVTGHWSLEQICHALVKKHPSDEEIRVSPETIYQALYVEARGEPKNEAQAALRTGRARRKSHSTGCGHDSTSRSAPTSRPTASQSLSTLPNEDVEHSHRHPANHGPRYWCLRAAPARNHRETDFSHAIEFVALTGVRWGKLAARRLADVVRGADAALIVSRSKSSSFCRKVHEERPESSRPTY